MDRKLLSERDICTKFITPAIKAAGWVGFTKGRIIVRGKLVSRARPSRRLHDALLYAEPIACHLS